MTDCVASRDLCSVPGCLHYVATWRLVGKGEPQERHFVGFCAAHAKLGPYEQRRLL